MKVSPILQCTLSLISPILISGPLVSNNIAAFNLSDLIKSINLPCDSCVPCEKFNLKTFTPVSYNFFIISSEDDAGPNVATILVFLLKSKNGLSISSFSLFSSFSDIDLFDSVLSFFSFKFFFSIFSIF
jgi:hypothetical protein